MPAYDRRRRLTAFVVAIAVLIATPLAVVASDAFGDVPYSNIHYGDITWLRDADITRGCNPPANDEFCPDQPVLRQQMASFMRRLAENQVVDAGLLAGRGPDEITTRVVGVSHTSDPFTGGYDVIIVPGSPTTVASLSLEPPTSGHAALSYTASIIHGGTGLVTTACVQLNDPVCSVEATSVPSAHIPGTIAYSSGDIGHHDVVAGGAVVGTEGGVDRFTLCMEASYVIAVTESNLMAVFVPGGSP